MTDRNMPPAPQPSYEVPPNQGGFQQPPPQPNYGYAPQVAPTRQGWGSAHKDKWVAFVLAITLGPLGIHKFYLGYKSEGMIMLLVSIVGGLCFGLGVMAMVVISYIEAVKYVILTQEDFEREYVFGTKAWL
ncbi:MAG: TM2 domain-containing protein [Coriobacteriales bacterium]|jgi:TM2 domain-containing membrane protein YozV|nr:TM2 domain-containing protein [Coriobacteriales bacterium]